MRPRRTPNSTNCLGLEGGNEDHGLWVQFEQHDREPPEDDPCYGFAVFHSVWEMTSAERAAIAEGANIRLTVVGGHPPVRMRITEEELGRGT